MSRSHSLKDPIQHLKDLIAKKGVSGHHGTSFYGANVVWNPSEYSHSDTYDDAFDLLLETQRKDPHEYGALAFHLTHCRSEDLYYQLPDYYGTEGCMVYLRQEEAKNELAVTFVLPMFDASEFEDDIEILSHMALIWAKIAQRETCQVRLFCNEAFLRWETMEEDNLLFTEYESN